VHCGLGGHDIIRGHDGDDTLYGDACGAGGGSAAGASLLANVRRDTPRGNDRVIGGRGDDKLFGSPGADRLHVGPGSDRIFCGDGHDTVHTDGRDRTRAARSADLRPLAGRAASAAAFQ
jgi:Ca2+-binding RTX toxin-like protein